MSFDRDAGPERSGLRLLIAVWLVVAGTDTLSACSVCFGAADGPLLSAARLGVLVMAAITCVMLAVFATFFIRIARRTRQS